MDPALPDTVSAFRLTHSVCVAPKDPSRNFLNSLVATQSDIAQVDEQSIPVLNASEPTGHFTYSPIGEPLETRRFSPSPKMPSFERLRFGLGRIPAAKATLNAYFGVRVHGSLCSFE